MASEIQYWHCVITDNILGMVLDITELGVSECPGPTSLAGLLAIIDLLDND